MEKYISQIKRRRNPAKFCLFYLLYSATLFLCSTAIYASAIDNKSSNYFTTSMTAVYSTPDNPHCVVSSTDNIDELAGKRDSECNISSSNPDNQYVLLIVQDDKEDLRRFLISARTFMHWSYMAIHTWKLVDSGHKLFSPPVCPCSGKPKAVSASSVLFFSYYLASYINDRWSYLSSFIPSFSSTVSETSINIETGEPEKNLLHYIPEQLHAGNLLTLALDAAALRLDCQCGGYFSDAQGNFYFNGHLWMLMLNMGVFATDLALEYL